MYGKRGAFFGTKKQGFYSSIWIELIGFDKDKEDLGVADYLKKIGFVPQRISLHLTSVDFVNTHRGMEEEYLLPAYACSYAGHPCNDDRMRQDWTNYELKKLTAELQKHGIKVFASFFDMDAEPELEGVKKFTELHPELIAGCTNPDEHETGIFMIKRFADGTYYEDYLLKKLVETCKDYGFDGVQVADGLSSPRNAIWFADFSDDTIEQSGIQIPADVTDKVAYIRAEKRKEWIEFYRRRWGGFLVKIIRGLKDAGLEVAVNSAWTRDPLEALYRYGTDYRYIKLAGADYFVVEDTSSALAILGYEDNHNYELGYERRRLIHHEFAANLMCVRAQLGDMAITPLFMIWDNQEQWNVLHHMPVAMQRAAAVNFAKLYKTDGAWAPITNGPHFCLGDALSEQDWEFVRLSIDNGYTENAQNVSATFIWSDNRMENEMTALIENGNMHSALWLAWLMEYGAQIGGIVHIDNIDRITGDIVVTNFSLMPQKEQEVIKNYKGGKVIYVSDIATVDVSKITNPVESGWPRPLEITPVSKEIMEKAVEEINENANISLGHGKGQCDVLEVKTGEKTSKIFVGNEEYFYVLPEVKSKRKIKNIKIITKPDGYPLRRTDDTFYVRVPGRGIDIAEVEYED
ncbi:MAG: hypothetical protein E7417_00325 [Ruminococcaceae bacterium]|nr:hypothetical protein [Oscillospiraceae bacterium]